MKKKLIALALLAGVVLASFTGCTSTETDADAAAEEESKKTRTITLTAIVGKSTTEEAIAAVQNAINRLTKSEYKTQVILQLKTADEYVEYVESQVETIEAEIEAEEAAEKKKKEEEKSRRESERLENANKKNPSKWTTTAKDEDDETTVEVQEMETDDYGREIPKYPEINGASLDIVFITGADMYRDFVEKDYLAPLDSYISGDFKILNQYIYPTFLEAAVFEDATYAIPNNRMLDEYTYLLIDRELASQHGFNASSVTTLAACEAFLDAVKASNPDVTPINEIPALNYFQYVGDTKGLLGRVFDPYYMPSQIMTPVNLLTEPAYVKHEILTKKLEAGNYAGEGEKYAIEVRQGYVTTAEKENWAEDYIVVEYEKPLATEETVYSGMFAVSAYASDITRCMEVITMLNTDPELRDIYAFGVEGEHFEYNEDGTVHMLNNAWSMDFYHSGNTLIGSVPDTMQADYSDAAKQQNLETETMPYFGWICRDEDTAELYDAYIAASEEYYNAFITASDPLAYAADLESILAANPEDPISLALNKETQNGIVASYTVFYSNTYN